VILKGKVKKGKASLKSMYGRGFMSAEVKAEGVRLHGKNGKKYVIFWSKTPNGNYVGDKMFPAYGFSAVYNTDSNDLTVRVRAFARSRRGQKRKS